MLHGPCGLLNPISVCMDEGRCTKGFPKKYEDCTRFDKNGYVFYKRRNLLNTFIKNGIPLDNGYVVPYNKTLCEAFDAHINVEHYGWSMLIKYLFKYISKGPERVRYNISTTPSDRFNSLDEDTYIDEIQNFVDGRFICPHEAAWRIFDFPIHHRQPAVQILSVHLEGMQNITFKDRCRLREVINNPATKKTTLTEWLQNNRFDTRGRHLTYTDYVGEYWWHTTGKGWVRRVRKGQGSIGRLVYVHPSCGELFFLRLLLCCQVGCKSFNEIRTVNGNVCQTYRDAC
jgi:hypothetical protein